MTTRMMSWLAAVDTRRHYLPMAGAGTAGQPLPFEVKRRPT